MRHHLFVIASTFAIVFAASSSYAQGRVPDSGMWGVGASIGATVPRDASLGAGLEVAGNLEGYLTPRVSIRGQVGFTSWDITGRNFTGTVKPLFFTGNVVYNWEHGVWHPYVTGGVGAYRFHSDIDPSFGGSDTKAGVDLGGGIEYFLHRHVTITGEVLYHSVGSFNTPVTTFNDGSFWSFMVGGKRYF